MRTERVYDWEEITGEAIAEIAALAEHARDEAERPFATRAVSQPWERTERAYRRSAIEGPWARRATATERAAVAIILFGWVYLLAHVAACAARAVLS